MSPMIGQNNHSYDLRTVLKYAGAFMAFSIGSGFATGQEILRFFSSFGYASYGIVILSSIGFLLLGQILISTGYAHKDQQFNHFIYFCGNRLGTLYTWLIPVVLILLLSVLASGAGATFLEYYGVSHAIGSGLMSVLVLSAYLVGFEKMIRIISAVSPVVILFTLLVGTITVIRDLGNFSQIGLYEPVLSQTKASPNWILSAALYLSLNFLCGSTYFTELGAKAENRRSARMGALLGASGIVGLIAMMNTAILLNCGNTASLAIPALYLAQKISTTIGAMFSVILLLGIFSSCSTMMWMVCGRFYRDDVRKNRRFAVIVAICVFLMSLFPFARLLGVFYPLIGYLGLLFVGCVIYRKVKDSRRFNFSIRKPI